MKKKIEKLFSNLCCSHCKNSFDENSITIKREEEGLTVQEGPEPINYDDVIDAHRFIKNLDADWQKHLPQ